MCLGLVMLRLLHYYIRNIEGWRYPLSMSKYSCKCPAPGCSFVFTTTASSWNSAFKKMYDDGAKHIIDKHPDFPEVEFPIKKAKEFARKEMKCEKE